MNIMNVHGRQVNEMLEEVQFAVVPLGSMEYHGPHSPLGTDFLLAKGFAERIDAKLKPLIYPTVPYTACPGKTQDYSGTLSIRPAIFTEYLADILDGICQMGIRNILLLNAHDGNMGVSRTAAESVTAKWKDASFLLLNWWQMATIPSVEEAGIFQETTGRGHGGPYEMSALKGLWPNLVHVSESDLELNPSPPLSSLPYVLVEGNPQGWQGYTGKVKQTSLEAGQWIVEEVTRNMNQLIQSWLQKKHTGEE